MINFTSRTKYYISSNPTDMRKGREGLADVVREMMGHNPKCYDEAFIFCNPNLMECSKPQNSELARLNSFEK